MMTERLSLLEGGERETKTGFVNANEETVLAEVLRVCDDEAICLDLPRREGNHLLGIGSGAVRSFVQLGKLSLEK